MNTKELLLESASGFMMPFAASEEEDVQVSLGFGEQKHPLTGEIFNHKGVDFIAHDFRCLLWQRVRWWVSVQMPTTRTISS